MYNIHLNPAFYYASIEIHSGNSLSLSFVEAGRRDRVEARSAYGNMLHIESIHGIHSTPTSTLAHFDATDSVVNFETTYILHSTRSIHIPWTFNPDTHRMSKSYQRHYSANNKVHAFREIRAQGDLMESVLMIVNSIVGIQSKNITEKTQDETTKKQR